MAEEEENNQVKELEGKGFSKEEIIEGGKLFLERIYEEEEDSPGLEEGKGYLLKEKRPQKSISLFLEKVEEKDVPGYVISRVNPKKLDNKYDFQNQSVKLHWLTSLGGSNNLNPSNLPYIAHSMIDFLEKKRGIIFLEGVESLLKNNKFNEFLAFLDNIIDVVEVEEGTFITTLDPETISEQRLAQIERKLEVIS